jgi:hypothetical protein
LIGGLFHNKNMAKRNREMVCLRSSGGRVPRSSCARNQS